MTLEDAYILKANYIGVGWFVYKVEHTMEARTSTPDGAGDRMVSDVSRYVWTFECGPDITKALLMSKEQTIKMEGHADGSYRVISYLEAQDRY